MVKTQADTFAVEKKQTKKNKTLLHKEMHFIEQNNGEMVFEQK